MSPKPELVAYGYFRSSAAYRLRIALNLKGLKPDWRFIHLLKDGGQQHAAAYKALNPQGLVPALSHDGHTIGQSLAIIEYLDEVFPDPPLLPGDAALRARIRQTALVIACDIHPLNNLRVLQDLRARFGADDAVCAAWQANWITKGFLALEQMLAGTSRFCHGDVPSLADVCLIPQMANARRISLDLSTYPRLVAIEAAALALPAFDLARPEKQPDA